MEGPELVEAIAQYFKFTERGTNCATEARAGLTAFMVRAYIIFVNQSILTAGFGDADARFNPASLAAATALVAGIMTIAMGVIGNYPFALAAGLGINAIVAFSLTGAGLSPAGAMGVIVLEGLLVTVLVLVGLREAIMNAVPLALKRAIGVGIGLFILFIGFANGGLVVAGGGTLVTFAFPTTPSQFVFIAGLLITIVLWVMKIRGALILSIIATTVLAIIAGVQELPKEFNIGTLDLSTVGAFDVAEVWELGLITAALTIFAIMLIDFFDTMGTVTGVAAEAGLARPDGSVPGIGRVLLVDSIGAVAGGRTGFASVVTGVLFLAAIFIAPLASIVPGVATAPALVLVGYLMFSLIKDIPVADVEDGLPALLTMILMPLTYEISVGVGAGFITWTIIKVVRGKMSEIHPLMWVVSIAFVVFFAKDWLNT